MSDKWHSASGCRLHFRRLGQAFSTHSRKAPKLCGFRGGARKSRHHNTLPVNHITLPSLNENLVGLNHRLITEPSLPGQQTNFAFPQAGSGFQHPTTGPGLKDPSSVQPSTFLHPRRLHLGPQPKWEHCGGGGMGGNPIAKHTEQEGWEQGERVEVANFSTFPLLWLKQWQIIYHTFWLHASWL